MERRKGSLGVRDVIIIIVVVVVVETTTTTMMMMDVRLVSKCRVN